MEEYAGKAVDLVLRFLHRRRMKRTWLTDAPPFETRESLRRLSGLASMVAGMDLRVADISGDVPPRPYLPILYRMAHPSILPEHGYGWTDGETVYLPEKMAEMGSVEADLVVTRLLVFFLSHQAVCGTLSTILRNRGELSGDTILRDIFWIIENTRLFHVIRSSYPGLVPDWEAASRRLLERRPDMELLTKAERKVEAFLRGSVEETFGGGAYDVLSSSADESLDLARGLKAEWAEGGDLRGRYRGTVPFVPWGKPVPDRIRSEAEGPGAINKKGGKAHGPEKDERPGTTGDKRQRFASRTEEVDEKACEEGLTLNIYDKMLSWAEFVNVHRPFDDDPDDEAGKKAREMEELTTSSLERTTTSSFDAELEKAGAVDSEEDGPVETGPETFSYPEWDYRKKAYRESYSLLTETPAEEGDPSFARAVMEEKKGVVREVTRQFEVLTPEMRPRKRQLDGDEIDLEASVEAFVDMATGRQPDERFYSTQEKTERDISALFLIDLSMSTDSWVGEKKIIEHEKESLVVLAEALGRIGDRYSLYGFSGKGRKGAKAYRIKGFGEGYGEAVRSRIGGLIPHEYTRMGPAIRHASRILGGESARVRLLFIISDGKPNDIDVYEGRYGIEDTRKAVKEAEQDGIVVFCLTVESGARDYLPRIFGRSNYAVVSSVERLAKKLPELYARISAGI